MKTPTKTKTRTKSRAKTSRRFVLRVAVKSALPTTRSDMRAMLQQNIDRALATWPTGWFKSARVTNADIP